MAWGGGTVTWVALIEVLLGYVDCEGEAMLDFCGKRI